MFRSAAYSPFALLALVSPVLLSVACVDLTPPWQKDEVDGGARSTGGMMPRSHPTAPRGGAGGSTAGGIMTSPNGGAGGSTAGGNTVSPNGGAGGVSTDAHVTDIQDAGLDVAFDLSRELPVGADLAVDQRSISALAGLVAYYPCEGATDSVLPDLSGNGNDALLGVSPRAGSSPTGQAHSFDPGKIGNALTLYEAGRGYAAMPPRIFYDATAMTFAAWLKVNKVQNWQRFFDAGINSNRGVPALTDTKFFNLMPQNDKSQLQMQISANGYGSQQLLSGPAMTPENGWRHVAVTLNGSQATLYLDGSVLATSASVTLRPSELGAIDYAYLGRSGFTLDPTFDGQMDEIRIYRRALSAEEITILFQMTGP